MFNTLLSFLFISVTGNANFNMSQTSFTLLGFTQPHAAMPIIEDLQNNAKGFTSRILWYFPTPVFCKMRHSILTHRETQEVESFSEKLDNITVISFSLKLILKQNYRLLPISLILLCSQNFHFTKTYWWSTKILEPNLCIHYPFIQYRSDKHSQVYTKWEFKNHNLTKFTTNRK